MFLILNGNLNGGMRESLLWFPDSTFYIQIHVYIQHIYVDIDIDIDR